MRRIARQLVSLFVLALLIGLVDAQELTLFSAAGSPVAYIDTADNLTIYLWDGLPVAYLVDATGETFSIYSFPGNHLGWLEQGIVWTHSGSAVGWLEGALDIPTQPLPIKGLKRLKPLKGLRRLAPLKPIFDYQWSQSETLTGLLLDSSSNAVPSSPRNTGGGSYSGIGIRHWIQRVEAGGRIVHLEDGSRWEVYLVDRIDSMLWLPVTDIEVELARSPVGEFRYVLINTDDDESVRVKYLGGR